jgi:hypothetical protein
MRRIASNLLDENGRIGFYVELPSENNPGVQVVQSLRGDWRIYSIEHLASTGAAPQGASTCRRRI